MKIKWKPEHLELLKARYAGESDLKALSMEMGRTVPSIKCKAFDLGLSDPRRIEKKDEEYISSMAGIVSITDVARKMNRCWNTVKKIIVKLGLLDRYTPVNSLWTPSEEELAVMRSPLTLKQISKKIGRAEASIVKKCQQMGIARLKRAPKVPKPREPRVRKQRPPTPDRKSGENRIREAMERLRL